MKENAYIILDTETANGHTINGKLDLSQSLPYNIAWKTVNKKGKVLSVRSYASKEIFLDTDLMNSAYYADKIPTYWEQIENGEMILTDTFTARRQLFADCKDFNVKAIIAHNARFDVNALNNIVRLLTGSKCRFFFPKNVEIWDSLKMSYDVFTKLKGYTNFCKRNGYMTKHNKPRVKLTAEVLYKYISGDYDFKEEHKALEDVNIETEIFLYLLSTHKKMRKNLFKKF